MKNVLKTLMIIVLTIGVSVATTLYVVRHTEPSVVIGKSTIEGDSASLPLAYARFSSLPQAGETDFTQAAELSVNAVVHVKTTYKSQQMFQTDPLLEFFFGRPQQQRQPAPQASGSGVIITADGYIVTNNHVIDKAEKIEVVLNDKREFVATLVGTDPNTDIALLKIEAENLPIIAVGNSDDLRVGEWVLAVGNPFNLTSTVTAGIVSAKARNINIISSDMKIESFIQTDAAVNPGNSGGALVNTRGELVGINTAIASQTGSYSGYSFAVPTSIMTKVVSDIKQYGVVQRAILGVQIQEITDQLRKEKNLPTLQGAYIAGVVDGSAAKEAGVEVGDVVTAINSQRVTTGSELQEQIGRYRPGDKIELTLLRDGKQLTLTAELRNKNGNTAIVEKNRSLDVLGADFEAISVNTARSLGLRNGVEVKALKKGALQKSGIKQGYVIVKANGERVTSTEQLQQIMNNALQADAQEHVIFLSGMYPNGQVAHYAVALD